MKMTITSTNELKPEEIMLSPVAYHQALRAAIRYSANAKELDAVAKSIEFCMASSYLAPYAGELRRLWAERKAQLTPAQAQGERIAA